jgi:hypothetical protein
MKPRFDRVQPLPVAVLAYLALVAAIAVTAWQANDHVFVYAQDDPYIHLSLARTLAEHGVWGVRPDAFTSASSSPGWTLLLAALWKAGVHVVWLPFALNVLAGCVLLWAVNRATRQAYRERAQAVLLLGLVFVTPLPTLAFIGMEHTLHCLLVLLFAWAAAGRLSHDRGSWGQVLLLAMAMGAVRYESLFLVAGVCLALLWQRRLVAAIALGCAGTLPAIAFAAYSVAHGGWILPGSVLIKSGPARFSSIASGVGSVLGDWVVVFALFERPLPFVLMVAVLVGLLLTRGDRVRAGGRPVWLALLCLWTALLHACLVKLDWFFRYESYLLALGLLALTALHRDVAWPTTETRRGGHRLHPAVVPLVILLGWPFAVRALSALATTWRATSNVYQQQLQLGRFVRQSYDNDPVLINDIGAVGWMSNAPLVDIVGLASPDVAELRRADRLDRRAVEALAARHHVKMVALYADIFVKLIPATWTKVGSLRIEHNVAVAADEVTFFAASDEDAARLRTSLVSFVPTLPAGVTFLSADGEPHTQ